MSTSLHTLRLRWGSQEETDRKEAVIIYGASSSVGAYAVQLAKLAGYFVVGVAGSSSAYVQEMGADVVLDYRKHGEKPEELVGVIATFFLYLGLMFNLEIGRCHCI